MKFILTGIMAVGMATASVQAQEKDQAVPTTADNVAPEGFTQLFNGKDLSNWKGLLHGPFDKPHKRVGLSSEKLATEQEKANISMKKHWSVTDKGELYFDGRGKSLVTVKKYKNFEFHVSWKILKNGDSGIYLRGLPQIQIWDTKSKATKPHGGAKGSGALWNNRNSGRWPLVHADNPVGEWNHFFVRMVGDKVSVWLNGKQTVKESPLINLWQKGKPLPEREQIELQCHGHPVWFKNIYVRELK